MNVVVMAMYRFDAPDQPIRIDSYDKNNTYNDVLEGCPTTEHMIVYTHNECDRGESDRF